MLELTPDRRLTGGLRLLAHKSESTTEPILRGLVPPELILPLHQHGGNPAVPIVDVGREVAKGETVAAAGDMPSAAVHASSSGRVRAIEERLVPTGSRLRRSLCIVIETDGEDRRAAPSEPLGWPESATARIERIAEGGLAGLGGAVFPTAAKLAAVAGRCKALIVNGAECEPYISCDDMLMREAPEEIVAGALLMCDLVGAPVCILVIERDKPRAIEAIGAAARAAGDPRLRLAEVPTIYPAGGERQLVELLTAEEVPSGEFPSAIGYVCQNVGTAFALHRLATRGEPLTSRIVTITGQGVARPRNVEAPIGAPIGWLIEQCGGYRPDVARLIHGGSMMGYALPSDDLPITKATSCIVAAGPGEVRQSFEEWACIRCGDCASACPARLQPQELLVAAGAGDFARLEALGLDDCIECGCCDVVCPSHIVLTERFRAAKRAHAAHVRRLELSAESEERYRRRERRIEDAESRARAAQEALKAKLRADEAARREAIEAAVERARRRKSRNV
ncbi:MAG TPA: electron transport complex subunit RsxC [Gammaproteobacteria bacterium]